MHNPQIGCLVGLHGVDTVVHGVVKHLPEDGLVSEYLLACRLDFLPLGLGQRAADHLDRSLALTPIEFLRLVLDLPRNLGCEEWEEDLLELDLGKKDVANKLAIRIKKKTLTPPLFYQFGSLVSKLIDFTAGLVTN